MGDKLRITIITSPFSSIPPKSIGAVEKLWYYVAKIFVAKGHDVGLVSKRIDKNDKTGCNDDGICVRYINGFKSQKHILVTIFFDFFYSVKALCYFQKSDVLIMNTFWTPILCPLFKNKYKVAMYNVQRFPKKQFFLYKKVDRLSCVSLAVKSALAVQTPSVAHLLKVINNPVDTEIFLSKPKDNIDDVIRILYSGRIHPEKGLDILVKAFCKLKNEFSNICLTLVGAYDIARSGGGKEYVDYLVSLAQGNKINFVDAIYNPKSLCEEMQQHDIYIYPSVAEKGETFGVAPLEAMAAGIPTIVSALECFRDFAINSENALVFNHRTQTPDNELYEAIKTLIGNPELRKKISLNGAKTARENFSTEKIAEEYLEDFNNILKNKNEWK
ncbi:MAG: glycosyltransferase family 4 protein [Dysgonamonadaceae bacterium]|jgi:glycosyltransferase involved in cell wall biosynthesis|nr:glycosyltransferase family 4 protein [Dysgonamonadaceae bacterium]